MWLFTSRACAYNYPSSAINRVTGENCDCSGVTNAAGDISYGITETTQKVGITEITRANIWPLLRQIYKYTPTNILQVLFSKQERVCLHANCPSKLLIVTRYLHYLSKVDTC